MACKHLEKKAKSLCFECVFGDIAEKTCVPSGANTTASIMYIGILSSVQFAQQKGV